MADDLTNERKFIHELLNIVAILKGNLDRAHLIAGQVNSQQLTERLGRVQEATQRLLTTVQTRRDHLINTTNPEGPNS